MGLHFQTLTCQGSFQIDIIWLFHQVLVVSWATTAEDKSTAAPFEFSDFSLIILVSLNFWVVVAEHVNVLSKVAFDPSTFGMLFHTIYIVKQFSFF